MPLIDADNAGAGADVAEDRLDDLQLHAEPLHPGRAVRRRSCMTQGSLIRAAASMRALALGQARATPNTRSPVLSTPARMLTSLRR